MPDTHISSGRNAVLMSPLPISSSNASRTVEIMVSSGTPGKAGGYRLIA